MKITSFHIDGFGIFSDTSVTDLSGGLSVFLGDNEAGKTTLLSFLRAMLWSPTGSPSKGFAYPPLRGGSHAGLLEVVTDAGEPLALRRELGKRRSLQVTDAGGRAVAAERWAALLGGMSQEAYNAVFAFSLTELQCFESLSADAVKDALYGAGAGVGVNKLGEAQRYLDKQMGELYLHRGRTKQLNVILNELKEVRRQLHEAQRGVARYQELHDELEKLQAAIEQAQQEVSRLRMEQMRHQRLLEAWPMWVQWQQVAGKLDRGERIGSFPVSAMAPWQKARAVLDERVTERDKLHEQIAAVSAELETLTVDREILTQEMALEALREKKQQYEDYGRELIALGHEVEAAGQDMIELRREMGVGGEHGDADGDGVSDDTGNEGNGHHSNKAGGGNGDGDDNTAEADGLLSQDCSMPTRDRIGRFQQQESACQQRIEQLEREHQEKRQQHDRLWERLGRGLAALRDYDLGGDMSQMMSADNALGLLDELKERLAQAYEALHDYAERVHTITALSKDIEHCQQRLDDWAGRETAEGEPWYERHVSWLRVVVRVTAIVIGVVVLMKRQWAPAGLVLLGYGAVEYFLARVGRRGDRVDKADQSGDPRAGIEHELDELRRQREALLGENEQVKTAWHWQRLDDQLMTQLREPVRDGLRHVEQAIEDYTMWRRDTADNAKQLSDARAARDEHQQQWRSWLKERDWPVSLTVKAALDYAQLLERYQQCHVRRETCFQQMRQKQSARREFETQLGTILDALEEAWSPTMPAVNVMEVLLRRLTEAREQVKVYEEKKAGLKQYGQHVERLDKAISETEESLRAMYAEAGVDNAEQWQRRYEQFQTQQQWQQEREQLEQGLCRVTGWGDWELLREQLAACSREELEQGDGALALQLENAEQQNRQMIKQEMEYRQQLKMLSDSQEVGRLRQEEVGLQVALQDAAGQWARLAAANTFIQQARGIYEQEKQPAVIREARERFSRLTDGAYEQVVSPLDDGPMTVADRHKQSKTIEQLSRGTAEQLYLALRLSYIHQHSGDHEQLPVIMDDIMVNFDPGRGRRAVEELARLAQTQQLFFFTCHPATAELFLQVSDKSDTFRIERGEIVRVAD